MRLNKSLLIKPVISKSNLSKSSFTPPTNLLIGNKKEKSRIIKLRKLLENTSLNYSNDSILNNDNNRDNKIIMTSLSQEKNKSLDLLLLKEETFFFPPIMNKSNHNDYNNMDQNFNDDELMNLKEILFKK